MKRFVIILCLLLAFFSVNAQSRNEITISIPKNEIEFNPYKTVVSSDIEFFSAIYEGLFSYNPQTLEPEKANVLDYEKSKDGKTWTFKLRQDIFWEDGSPVTAFDYEQSWLYLINPETKANFSVFFDIIQGVKDYRTKQSTDTTNIGIKAIDEKTLEVKLTTAIPYLTKLLCHSSFCPIHKSLRFKENWTVEDIIGNGPFVIVSSDDSSIVVEKSNYYWDRDNVKLNRINILQTDDEQMTTQLYNTGSIDWVVGSIDLQTLIYTESIQISPMFATGFYYWNCKEKPWNDPRLRRALSLLIPWDKIRSSEFYYHPTSNLIFPFSGYNAPLGINKQDEKKAMQYLEDAGFPNGQGLPNIRFMYYESESHNHNVDIIEEAWAKIGITIEKIKLQTNENISKSTIPYDIGFSSWIGDFADPMAFLMLWQSTSMLNSGNYKSLQYDKLLDTSMKENGENRLKTLAKVESKLLQDAVVLPLYHPISLNIIDTQSIGGWYNNPLDIHPLKSLYRASYKMQPNMAKL